MKAMKNYGVNEIAPTQTMAKQTGCTKEALAKIVNKGMGAYYSSGSRPNQNAQSLGFARLASSITAGKAAAVDYIILKDGCKPGIKALRLANKAKSKYGHGQGRVPKTQLK